MDAKSDDVENLMKGICFNGGQLTDFSDSNYVAGCLRAPRLAMAAFEPAASGKCRGKQCATRAMDSHGGFHLI